MHMHDAQVGPKAQQLNERLRDLSDIRFTDTNRVPHCFQPVMRSKLRLGFISVSSDGPYLTDVDGNKARTAHTHAHARARTRTRTHAHAHAHAHDARARAHDMRTPMRTPQGARRQRLVRCQRGGLRGVQAVRRRGAACAKGVVS